MDNGSARKPNILLISTDQQRFDHLGVAGTPGIVTPHLDRLAGRGMRFSRAYCTSPICTPSRVSLLTGRYPSSHGAYSIGVTADPLPGPTLPEVLRSGGYETAVVGKTHFVARKDEPAHLRGKPEATDEDFKGWNGPYLGFDHVKVSVGHTINCVPNMHYREFLENAGVDYANWFPQMAPGYDNQVAGAWNIPAQFHDTQWVADESLKWLDQRTGRPWFLWASFQDPHEPFVCPEPWFSEVDREALQVFPGPPVHGFRDRPAYYGDVLEKGEDGWGDIEDGHGVPCVFRWPQMDAQARTALQATAGMIRFLDDRIGAILSRLETSGQLENTVVIFTSDHGEMHGHHGFWGKGLMAFEDCQRVPLLVAGPGVGVKGPSEALVSLVDLPRTILSLANLDVPEGFQGSDLTPLLAGRAEAANDHVFIECEATHRIGQLTCVTHRYKLVAYRDSPEGELYDLQKDPDQLQNLWGEPGLFSLREDMLERWVRPRLGDFVPRRPRTAFA
jgi:arylsulfatase A-like enzyme